MFNFRVEFVRFRYCSYIIYTNAMTCIKEDSKGQRYRETNVKIVRIAETEMSVQLTVCRSKVI